MRGMNKKALQPITVFARFLYICFYKSSIMETIVINTKTNGNAKLILQLVKKMGDTAKILTKQEQEDFLHGNIVQSEKTETPYDPKFVAKIKAREKESRGKKLTRVNPDDVWGSIL